MMVDFDRAAGIQLQGDNALAYGTEAPSRPPGIFFLGIKGCQHRSVSAKEGSISPSDRSRNVGRNVDRKDPNLIKRKKR